MKKRKNIESRYFDVNDMIGTYCSTRERVKVKAKLPHPGYHIAVCFRRTLKVTL